MSKRYRLAQHEVIGVPIVEVLPLQIHERTQSPEAGVLLLVENSAPVRWLPEGGKVPNAGDFMVRDEVFGITFTVPAKQFAEMFTEEK